MNNEQAWVILKFGGVSVSSAGNWRVIASLVEQRLESGEKPLVVQSALAGVSDGIAAWVRHPLSHSAEELITDFEARHRELAAALDIGWPEECEALLSEFRRRVTGGYLIGDVSPALQAEILAHGELLASRIGHAYLTKQNLPVRWADARELLTAVKESGRGESAQYLSAVCDYAPDDTLQARLGDEQCAILTQGFIAKNAAGKTVVLGRGGSDTSAAYLATRLSARRLEIWTDVPGMFSANPRLIPTARLLKKLGYGEAQEIATTGAKVLHPRSLEPVRRYRIPLSVHCTSEPELPGTEIGAATDDQSARVKAVSLRAGITLVSMETMGMWQQVGFLADAFGVFKKHGLSVDSVSTSETNVTVSLDREGNPDLVNVLPRVAEDLSEVCTVKVIENCAALSLVGRHIRAILHELAPALEIFAERRVHLVCQAASDLNLTFIVDESDAERLAQQLHGLLIKQGVEDAVLGPTWQQLHKPGGQAVSSEAPPWWAQKRDDLLALSGRGPLYVYDGDTIDSSVDALSRLNAVDRLYYAIKANDNEDILRRMADRGLGFECVSRGELEHIFNLFPEIDPEKILFTPNFAPHGEYIFALEKGVNVTLDNLGLIHAFPDAFSGRQVLVRVDPGRGRGHHQHVRTAGASSKFGVPLDDMRELTAAAAKHDIEITGLHAHAGSGILDSKHWFNHAALLAEVAAAIPGVRYLNLGGGLGVPEKPGDQTLDIEAMNAHLTGFKQLNPQYELWLEPGRYAVAGAGALLVQVTQTKTKQGIRYVGVNAGMNALIRPALYGAYHDIVNLSRLKDEPAPAVTNIVGPICESGDILGTERLLPECRENDVLLVANAGAYGAVMSSRYNRRATLAEVMI
ncbi:MAG: bifunctional aspartate kinase/diaminopimelate decarboxylase [Gammaproteobacteria bacterium]|nr:bifunctional aspartate kinase/diaminopimelate decarboxylase [Gammaproteobacteria bacterium]